MIIGICGGSGSGKTTLLHKLADEYKHLSPTLFSLDNYYKPIHEQFVDENGKTNFDLPDSLNKTKAFEDLKLLKAGKAVEIKEYLFNTDRNKNVLITLEPSELIIVEGLFILHYQEIREQIDFNIFVEVELEVQLDRRLYRDQETRGYSRDDILYQWNNHVLPCYYEYLLPYREMADFHFQNGKQFDEEFLRLKRTLVDLVPNE